MCVESLAFRDVLDLVSLYRRRKWQAETRRPPPRLSGPRTSLPKERPQLTKTNKQTNKRTNERNRERKTEKRKHRTPERKQKKQNKKKRSVARARHLSRKKPNKPNRTQPNFFRAARPNDQKTKRGEPKRKKKQAAKNKKETDRQGVRPRRCVPFLAFHYIFFLCVLVLSFKFAKNLGLAMMIIRTIIW